MKNILFTAIALMILSPSVYSQATLEFSAAKLVGSEQTVPTGKVWKISNVLPSTRVSSASAGTSSPGGGSTQVNSASTEQVIVVDGTNVYIGSSNANTINYAWGNGWSSTLSAVATSEYILDGAIWLPEGTTLAAGSGVFRVSVLEFNIVP